MFLWFLACVAARPVAPPAAPAALVVAPAAPELAATEPAVLTVHWSEAQVKLRVTPKPPTEAQGTTDDQRCTVRVRIDVSGIPVSVVPKLCPEVYRAGVTDALMQWRWYPLKREGVAVAAQFDMTLAYKRPP